MGLSGPEAGVIAAIIPAGSAIWLGWRTRGAKRDALEKLVTAAVKAADTNHKDEIARVGQHNREQIEALLKQHREYVEWLQGQIRYYQQMSAPRQGQRPNQPPKPQ